MDRQEIVQLLQDLNPQWQSKEVVEDQSLIERDYVEELESRESVRGLVGLRRTGKTTVMKQLIQESSDQERTCYFSFDLESIDVKTVVETFCQEILEEPLNDLDSEVMFFFDEVQNLDNWSNQVKHFEDNYSNISFTVTGSSAANILKGSGESLAGRISFLKIQPFTYREFLQYNNIEAEKKSLNAPKPASREEEVHFQKYFEEGGMPELYQTENPVERLEETLDLIFFRDIVEMFNASRTEVLKGIFKYLAANTGQEVNYNKIADTLDTDFRTIKKYLGYLEDSFLINRSQVHTENTAKSMRKNPKIYIADHAYNRIYGTRNGLKAETVAYNHLKKIEEPRYMKKPETDIVLPEEEKIFEVKYQNHINNTDLKNLLKNTEKTGFKPYIISKNTHETREINGKKVEILPLHTITTTV